MKLYWKGHIIKQRIIILFMFITVVFQEILNRGALSDKVIVCVLKVVDRAGNMVGVGWQIEIPTAIASGQPQRIELQMPKVGGTEPVRAPGIIVDEKRAALLRRVPEPFEMRDGPGGGVKNVNVASEPTGQGDIEAEILPGSGADAYRARSRRESGRNPPSAVT